MLISVWTEGGRYASRRVKQLPAYNVVVQTGWDGGSIARYEVASILFNKLIFDVDIIIFNNLIYCFERGIQSLLGALEAAVGAGHSCD